MKLNYDYKQKSPILNNEEYCEKIKKVIEEKYKKGIKYEEKLIYSSKEDSIKNLLRYKITENKEELKKHKELEEIYKNFHFDCDSVEEVKKILIKLLQTKLENKINKQQLEIKDIENSRKIEIKIKDNINILETDTMNSFVTTFNQFIREYLKQKYNKTWLQLYTKGYETENLTGGFIKNHISKYSWLLENYNQIVNKANEREKEIFKKFNKFAFNTHTIGNFIFVPEGYNVERYEKTNDYWDLTLVDLKQKALEMEWYNEKYKWYIENINLFLLEDYFEKYDENKKITNLKIKPLYTGNKFNKNIIENNKNKLTEEEYNKKLDLINEYLENVNKFIENRTKKILEIYK